MKRSSTFICALVFAMLAVMAACGSPPQASQPNPIATALVAGSRGKILLIAREHGNDLQLHLTKEVGVMVPMLEQAGFDVVVATASGQPIVGGSMSLPADLKLGDVTVDDYVGVLIPCLGTGDTRVIPPEAVEIVKQAVAKGMPVAAQHSAIQLLGPAGVLKGKRYAVYDYTVPEGIDGGKGVVQDGNIITASTCPTKAAAILGRPDTTAELTRKLIDSLASAR